MALDGIRLSDLYTSKDYNDWMKDSTNSRLVESAIKQASGTDPDMVRGHLYLNSRIKSAIGEEGFAKLPHMNLNDKLNWYNTHIGFNNESSDTEELIQPQTEQRDTVSTLVEQPQYKEDIDERSGPSFTLPMKDRWSGKTIPGTSLRDWFKENAEGDYSGYLESRRQKREEARKANEEFPNIDLTGIWGGGYKSGETKQLEDELSVMRETNPGNTFGIQLKENQLKLSRERDFNATKDALSNLYKEEDLRQNITDGREGYFSPIDRNKWGEQWAQKTVDELTTNLRDRFDKDGTFAFDTFKSFEEEMEQFVPQYRNYHDSWSMPFTPDEMKDVMAEYYAIRQLKDQNEALSFASAVFQNRLAEKQGLWDKAATAIKQDGANIAGNTIATVGIVANSINGLIGAIDNDWDIEDLGGFKEFLYYSADNPITRWGNRMITTGVWQPGLQEAYEEAQFNALQLQRAAGNETKFWDVNTPFELFAQSGFTVAGMATGTATAQVLSNTVGRGTAALATRMLARESASAASRITSRAINVLGKELVTVGTAYLPAAAEASMDAVETYQFAKDNASEAVLMGMQDQLKKEYEDGTYDMWYQQNTRIPYELDMEVGMSEEQKAELAQLRAQERAYLWDTYQSLRQQEVLSDPEVAQMIEIGAKRAAAKNMFDEATWIALGDYTISNTLGKAFKETKRAARQALFGENVNNKFKWVPEGNHYRPVVKEITWRDKLGAISRGVAEAGEEGFEELFQTVDTKMRQDLNQHMVAEYIKNRFDPEGAAAVTDRMFENWEVTKASLNENLLSDEALFSFAIGALSAGLGSPTGFRGVQTFQNTLSKTGSFKSALKEGIVASWRNPIAENLGELKVKQIQDQQEANDLNRWISAHPEIDTLNDEAAIVGFLDKQAQAIRDGDEATYRDALMGQQVATMLMYERVNPNGSKVNFYERIKQLSKLSANDPQARNVLDQVLNSRGTSDIVRTEEGPLNEEEQAVLQDVKDKATKLLSTYKNLKAEIAVLDGQFGESISREAKEALAYSLIMQKDWDSRISSIHKKAVEAFNEANPDTPVTPISEEERPALNALARYGNREELDKEYKALMQQRAALRARKGSMYRYEYQAAFAKNQKALKENRDAAKALAKLEEDRVITAEEILSLGNKERAYLLDEANRGNFSEKQQVEIQRFLSSDGIRGDMVTDLIDAGRLQNKKEYFKEEYDALMRHNGAFIPIFDREIRKEASKTWTRAKLATAMEATSYDEFRDAMDKSLQTGEFSDADRMTMAEIFNEEGVDKQTYDFYQRYKTEEMTRRSLRSIIENSPEFQNMSEDQKEVVKQAVEQVQRDGKEVTTESILSKLSDPEYRSQLERQGVDVSSLMNATTFEELGTAVDKAMKQKALYEEQAKALKEAADQKAKERVDKENDPTKTPKPAGKEKDTVISKERYEKDKTALDGIFRKVADALTKRKAPKLTTDEYQTLMGLYSQDPATGKTLIDDLNTELTPEALAENIDRLQKAVENKLYTDKNAAESEEVQNSLKLAASMQGILSTMQSLRKAGVSTNLSTFLKNSILEMNGELKKFFEKKQIKLSKQVNKLNAKAEAALSSKTEKDWYEQHHIKENLDTLTELTDPKTEFVFMKDSQLESDLSQEMGEELDDDNVPIIIAARVPKGTKNAIVGQDGYTYLYVGLLQDSRFVPVAEERNEYNSLRNLAMEQENDGPLVYNGSVIKSVQRTPRKVAATQDKTETTSFRDFLFDKYKHIADPEKRRDAIAKDFIENYRIIQTITENGEVKGSYKDREGHVQDIRWATTSPDSKKPYSRAAYIMEDGTPLFLEVRDIDELTFDDKSLYEMLSDDSIDFYDKENEKKDGNYVRKAVRGLVSKFEEYKDALSSKKGRVTAITKLSEGKDRILPGEIQKFVEKYFNLAKPWDVTTGPIRLGVEVVDDTLRFICWETGTEKDKQEVFGIPKVLSEIPLSEFNSGNPGADKVAITKFVREAIKTLIFDEEGNLRKADTKKDGNLWPIIKFEDNYQENNKENTKVFSREKVRLKLFGNIWQARKYAIKVTPAAVSVERVAVGPQAPVSPASPNAQQEAIKRITAPEYIDEHEGEHYQLSPNETEVTTFIKGGEEDVDWGDKSLFGQFATNLGTSVDKLYRVWRRNGRTHEGVVAYMKERGIGAWPGLSRFDVQRMLEQFDRVHKFFEERGEVEIDADLIFKADVEYDKKHKFLVGKPDIITVDKNGIYHIYDMKSFRYNAGAVEQVPGFKTMTFTINGKRDIQKDMDKWRKQMSMYKAMIESKLGKGTVSSELGVIPVRLGYSPVGSIDPYVVPGVGAHKINDSTGKPLHLSFSDVPTEKTPSGGREHVTRCYDQPIRLDAIEKLDDINPEGWKEMSAADTVRSGLNAARDKAQPAPIAQQEDLLQGPAQQGPATLTGSPELRGPVTMHVPLTEKTDDELLAELKAEGGDDDFFSVFDQEIVDGACAGTPAK